MPNFGVFGPDKDFLRNGIAVSILMLHLAEFQELLLEFVSYY